MDRKDVIIATSVVTIVILGYKLRATNRKVDRLAKATRKLTGWADIAHTILLETWSAHPELVGELSEEVTTNIHFQAIMNEEYLS